MRDTYRTVRLSAEAEIVEKRSRFIAAVMPVESEEEAAHEIELIRKKHRDARHNIFAYIIEENGLERCSDDGEPAGTAGVPVLNILKREGLSNTLVVVTRYFGGILLGTGGLVHAYSDAAKAGIAKAEFVNMRLCREVTVRCEYTLLGRIENELSAFSLIRGETSYAEDAALSLYLPESDAERFSARITDLTNSAAHVLIGGKIYKPFK